jgi:hypothetical protein
VFTSLLLPPTCAVALVLDGEEVAADSSDIVGAGACAGERLGRGDAVTEMLVLGRSKSGASSCRCKGRTCQQVP